MIFGRSGDPAHTVPGFAARLADLLFPIDADIGVIMPRLPGIVNSGLVDWLTSIVEPHAPFRNSPCLRTAEQKRNESGYAWDAHCPGRGRHHAEIGGDIDHYIAHLF
jgi:hypothetical protein